jgi:DNA-3-methyladenine glycosylase
MRGSRRAATLPVGFFERSAELVARELIGALIVSTVDQCPTAGRIVETEAYLGYDDPASHGYRHRRHAQNVALYGPPASWYVYRSYGMHWCANLVCQAERSGSAVLLRAVEPLEGLEVMQKRRGTDFMEALCAGPGRLCQALGITRANLDGTVMRRSPVRVAAAGDWEGEITVTPRIGITKAADWPLRFTATGSRFASRRSATSKPSGSIP